MPVAARPLVSVVIVNYNGGPYLLNTVSSALGSNVPIEVFVVDNGSVDGSIRKVRQAYGAEPRLRIIENNANLGFARANNIALGQASGEFLLLLNPDCIVKPDTLELMVHALRRDPGAGMAGCLIRNPDGSEQAGCRRSIPTPWSGLIRALHVNRVLHNVGSEHQVDLLNRPLPREPVHVEAISGAFMLVRREALNQAGPMDEQYFLHCEDLDWCKAFQEAGWNILFVPGVDIVHHKGACSAVRPLFVLWHKHRGMVRFYSKFLSRSYSAPLNLLVVLGIWLRFAGVVPVVLMHRLMAFRNDFGPVTHPVAGKLPAATALPPFSELRGMPILVTGGTGFLGTRLVQELLRQGARVRVLTRSAVRARGLWARHEVECLQGDLEQPASLQGPCEGIVTLIHLASCTHVLDESVDDGERHRQVTESGTQALLAAAQSAGVERFVFVSSVKAMGEENDLCLDESSPVEPETPYGIAKLQAERAVLEAGARTGMRATVLRLPMVYGPGNKGNLPRMIEAIRQGHFPPLPEVANRRSLVHVEDTVQALLLAVVSEEARGKVYIVTDGGVYSTREIYRLIAASLGRRPPRWAVPLALIRAAARLGDLLQRAKIPFPLKTGTVRKLLGSAWYSSDKIRAELGFAPRYDLERALPDIIAAMTEDVVIRGTRGRDDGAPALDS